MHARGRARRAVPGACRDLVAEPPRRAAPAARARRRVRPPGPRAARPAVRAPARRGLHRCRHGRRSHRPALAGRAGGAGKRAARLLALQLCAGSAVVRLCDGCGAAVQRQHRTGPIPRRCPACRAAAESRRRKRARQRPEIAAHERDYRRRYHERERERRNAQNAAWRAMNADARAEYHQAYRAANLDAIRERAAARGRSTKGRESARRYARLNPQIGRARERRRRVRLRGLPVVSYRDRDIFERDGWRCGICGADIDPAIAWPDPRAATIDHVAPVVLGGSDTPENVRPAHLRCNSVAGGHLSTLGRLAAAARAR